MKGKNEKKKCLCIIGARKGSERLPGKNKRILNGKPLYNYVVQAAIKSDCFDKIIFSTDDDDILNDITKNPEIITDKRPIEFATSNISMIEATNYILKKYKKSIIDLDTIVLLTPCHPFRTQLHIKEALSTYFAKNAYTLVSITPYPFPPELAIEKQDGKLLRKWSGLARKAEYKKKYYPNGALIIFNRDKFLKKKSFYTENTVGYEISWPNCIDIDYIEDLKLAEDIIHMIDFEI